MTSEDAKKNRKSRKKQKTRKDKWGQPVVLSEKGLEDQVEEEQDNNGLGGGGGGGDGEGEEYEEHGSSPSSGYEPKKVVVSGMPYSTTEDQIRDLFKDVGPIHQLQLSRFPDSGNFRGLAFLTFETEANARSALKLDGVQMGNRFVKVEQCRADPQRKRKSKFLGEPEKADGCFSVYVGNLSWNVTEDDIRESFEASKIVSVRFATDKRTGAFRGFCHIDFEDDEALEEAMKKNQEELHGRPMKIAYAVSTRNSTPEFS